MGRVESIWHWIFRSTPLHFPPLASLSMMLLGCLIVIIPASWRRTSLFATYIHETGHAIVALLTGRRIAGIRIDGNTSGSTAHIGAKNGLGRLLTAFAGYPAPGILGWGISALVAIERPRWAIAILALIAAILSIWQRSIRGWLISILIIIVAFILSHLWLPIVFAALYFLAGYLLMASPRTIWELHMVHRNGEGEHSDAAALREQTGVAAIIWELIFICVAGVCFYYTIKRIGF
jgi:hypothetical protein